MRIERFRLTDAGATSAEIRNWSEELSESVDVAEIADDVRSSGDAGLIELTRRFDSPEFDGPLRVDAGAVEEAWAGLEPSLREAMELTAANVRSVAEQQVDDEPRDVELPQGQAVSLREIPVRSAGIYAPGGRAAYPSSVLMCCIPAKVAGVERVALASPPGVDGRVHPLTLAAAGLCGVDEVYAMGGAQAIFALAYGTASVAHVDVIAGPGNAWVREAKRAVYGQVGIDSLAGPSELMLLTGSEVPPEWAALDLCAQAEHGSEGLLVAAAVEQDALDALEQAVEEVAARAGVSNAPLALVLVSSSSEAIELANELCPEHLELLSDEASAHADRVTTAGCVFVGPSSATAFGDYVAGSNHVLPTGGAGRFSGPLSPRTFRRSIATVQVPAGAAGALAPHVKALAEAEGFPVHGESAMIRR